jgi:hypothetical protein
MSIEADAKFIKTLNAFIWKSSGYLTMEREIYNFQVKWKIKPNNNTYFPCIKILQHEQKEEMMKDLIYLKLKYT